LGVIARNDDAPTRDEPGHGGFGVPDNVLLSHRYLHYHRR